jgi:hypothetical protein
MISMLLIFGSALDDQPARLAKRWAHEGRDAVLVTPADLSRPGWRLRRGCPRESMAAVGDRVVRGGDIRLVVSALPCVAPYDLPHVAEDDREYVAEEMSAFLLAWLCEMACTVVERPTPVSLAGCGRSRFEWAAMASSLGIAADPSWVGPTTAVTVVGGRAVGDVARALATAAEGLALAARRSLVTLRFAADDAPRLVGADARAEVGADGVADALLEWWEELS